MTHIRICIFALAFALVACGGGGSAELESSPVASKASTLKIVAYGDSTQQGSTFVSSEVGYVLAPPPAAEAQTQLQAWGIDAAVSSAGIGGTTSEQLLAGSDGSGLPWADRLMRDGASIVAINHGINDNGRDPKAFRATLEALVGIAQGQGRRVVLETANPLVAGTALAARFDLASHAALAQVTREVAAATGATLCDQMAAFEQAGAATLEHIPDGVHPRAQALKFKGQVLARCIFNTLP